MANVRLPKIVTYDYGLFKTLPGTSGAAGVSDTFFGPRNKALVDFHARNMTRLRGTNAFYYVLADQNRLIDGDRPLSNSDEDGLITTPEGTETSPFQLKRHAGFALYGERLIIGERLDSVRREVQPDWPYKDPIKVRGVLYEIEHEQEADERAAIYVKRGTYDIARVLCEREWEMQPRPGDVLRFNKLSNQYMDVEDVSRDEHRWGGDGFFVVYKLLLVKSSKYEPQRKIAEGKLIESPTNDPVEPNPGKLS